MVEFQLLERGESTVALLEQREQPELVFPPRIETIVRDRRLAEERQRNHQDDCRGQDDPQDERHAGTSRDASRRCSRASGQSATAAPNRNTMPAIQMKFTSGFTRTFA